VGSTSEADSGWRDKAYGLIPLSAIALTAVALALGAAWGWQLSPAKSRGLAGEPPIEVVAESPDSLSTRALWKEVEQPQVKSLLDSMVTTSPASGTGVSSLLHVFRYYGPEAAVTLPSTTRSIRVLDLLTDNRLAIEYFGSPPLEATRSGVRYIETGIGPTAAFGEVHRDQCLAAFGEAGIPLRTPLQIGVAPDGNNQSSLRSLLSDSVANFTNSQSELHWTAIAYTYYIPHQSSWTNRFGEVFNFDGLVRELLSRDLSRSSCGGTHIVYALATLDAAYRASRLSLSRESADALQARLEAVTDAIVSNQLGDGSWARDWHESKASSAPTGAALDSAGALLITGHLGEVLLRLPEEYRVPDRTLIEMRSWLLRHLQGLATTDLTRIDCPRTHAARTVRELSSFPSAGDAGVTGSNTPY